MSAEAAPRLLTPQQVSDRTGIAVSTLAKMRVFGKGPEFVKIGAAVRYPEDSLTAWISAQPRFNATCPAVK